MGLCKCPKRKITNQFCYEHRVNVCEYCLVSNHQKCIVLSYLQWLQDGDYNPICELCKQKLEAGECIRLVCYHVYHWACLNQLCESYPSTTAPAGYVCPTCRAPLFPSPNLISPVADVLREKVKSTGWGRNALRFLTDEFQPDVVSSSIPHLSTDSAAINERDGAQPESGASSEHFSTYGHDINSGDKCEYPKRTQSSSAYHSEDTAIRIEESGDMFPQSSSSYGQIPRRHIYNVEESQPLIEGFRSRDHDEDKYHRRSTKDRLRSQWRMLSTGAQQPRNFFRRRKFVYIILIIGALGLLVYLRYLGNTLTYNDPIFDPLMNPNVHVDDTAGI